MIVFSSGAPGVERSALKLARKLGIPTGGYGPLNHKHYDGEWGEADNYKIVQCFNEGYRECAMQNIFHADAIILIAKDEKTYRMAFTLEQINYQKKHLIKIKPKTSVENVAKQLVDMKVKTLYIAGNLEQYAKGIAAKAEPLVHKLLVAWQQKQNEVNPVETE